MDFSSKYHRLLTVIECKGEKKGKKKYAIV